ncbi:uncharacterized protein LOC141623732 isoform X2 [Silene latifolia]|uniref:uncharacterized protein LOC141623732 isoform X2 n=1 Tax=Silene latifolia TaxID=37657 RepID=UPI003D7898C9
MTSVCGRVRQALQSCTRKKAVVSKLCGTKSTSPGGGASKLPGFAASTTPKSSFQFSSNRLPVELRCVQSLMPLHSATASALFTSLLSVPAQSWGSLSQGFATPT